MNSKTSTRREIKALLNRYRCAELQREVLIKRRKKLIAELRQTNTDPTARNRAIDEADATLTTQIQQQDSIMLEALELMARIPAGTKERIIVELRHIDGKEWPEIHRIINLTSSPCYELYNRGLDILAESLSAEGKASAP